MIFDKRGQGFELGIPRTNQLAVNVGLGASELQPQHYNSAFGEREELFCTDRAAGVIRTRMGKRKGHPPLSYTLLSILTPRARASPNCRFFKQEFLICKLKLLATQEIT